MGSDTPSTSHTDRTHSAGMHTPTSAVHFGLNVRAGGKHGLRIDRSTYAIINKRSSTYVSRERFPQLWEAVADSYEDEDHRILTDEWCAAQQKRALENFDLNMQYFASLDRDEFNEAIDKSVTSRRKMREVTDLNDWDDVPGVYVMVLDDFRQVYVGVTTARGGIKKRISRHWSDSKEFDRLLLGKVDESILSIDSFRALDTTRIFAMEDYEPMNKEDRIIRSIPAKFVLNRVAGGDGHLLGLSLAIGADVRHKRRLT